MKSRWIVSVVMWVLVPVLPAAAQVQQAGCQSCAPSAGVPMMDSGTVWGTGCLDCGYKPSLFPPCPSPCDRTLLGELLYGVRDAVDCGLSRVSCCLFGPCGLPCGCENVCGCETASCGSGCDTVVDGGYSTMMPSGSVPSGVPQPAPTPAEPQANPFQDEPAPGAAAQPLKKASVPIRRAVNQRQRVRVQRTSFEESVSEEQAPAVLPGEVEHATHMSSAPAPGRRHYELRRVTSQRKTDGAVLQMAPIQESEPAVRFRGE